MFIRYLGQYKETNSPFSYLSFGSTILHLGHLQFYIVAISASGQERLYTAIVMALLWLWSSKDFDFGVRCLIQSYICVTPDLCDQIKNAKLSAMQSTRSQVDNKLGENVLFFVCFFLGSFFCTWVWKSTFENEEGDLVPVKKYMHIISCFLIILCDSCHHCVAHHEYQHPLGYNGHCHHGQPLSDETRIFIKTETEIF